MRWLLLLLLLAACTQVEPYVPRQYAVHETGALEISYVVRDGAYVACQGTIDGQRCTVDLLRERGMRMEDIAALMRKARNESGCMVLDDRKACLDGSGAIISYTDGSRSWNAQYVQ